MTVLDSVDDEGHLFVQRESPRQLPVEGNRLSAGRDPFYASLVIDIEPRQWIPCRPPPPVCACCRTRRSPQTRCASASMPPKMSRCRASTPADIRLVYLVDAPQRYFAGPLIPAHAPDRI